MKFKGLSSDCYGLGLWVWNKVDVLLYVGVILFFVYGSGYYSEWFLMEVLVFKYCVVIDGSDVIIFVVF